MQVFKHCNWSQRFLTHWELNCSIFICIVMSPWCITLVPKLINMWRITIISCFFWFIVQCLTWGCIGGKQLKPTSLMTSSDMTMRKPWRYESRIIALLDLMARPFYHHDSPLFLSNTYDIVSSVEPEKRCFAECPSCSLSHSVLCRKDQFRYFYTVNNDRKVHDVSKPRNKCN